MRESWGQDNRGGEREPMGDPALIGYDGYGEPMIAYRIPPVPPGHKAIEPARTDPQARAELHTNPYRVQNVLLRLVAMTNYSVPQEAVVWSEYEDRVDHEHARGVAGVPPDGLGFSDPLGATGAGGRGIGLL